MNRGGMQTRFLWVCCFFVKFCGFCMLQCFCFLFLRKVFEQLKVHCFRPICRGTGKNPHYRREIHTQTPQPPKHKTLGSPRTFAARTSVSSRRLLFFLPRVLFLKEGPWIRELTLPPPPCIDLFLGGGRAQLVNWCFAGDVSGHGLPRASEPHAPHFGLMGFAHQTLSKKNFVGHQFSRDFFPA